jgi:hypothetical protein
VVCALAVSEASIPRAMAQPGMSTLRVGFFQPRIHFVHS